MGAIRTAARALRRRALAVLATALALALVGAGLWLAFRDPAGKRITADFSTAIGVYAGSDVRVLGVRVGVIDSVRPMGAQVRVTMTVDREIAVPAVVNAVVVAPSIVADRYVQLTPAYTGGPQVPNDALIPTTRTATPAEIDQLYSAITKLTTELGPNGVNATGALSDLIATGAANLDGNGKAMGDMIERFGAATKTLSGSSDELFATIANLQKFTTMLKNNDGQVRQAEQQLAEVTGALAADREDLGAALDQLATALAEVKAFIEGNRSLIKSNVDKLASITQVLVDQRASLAEALDVVPLAAANVLNAYDPANRTLDGRGNLNELSMGPGAATAGRASDGSPAARGAVDGSAVEGSICAAAGASPGSSSSPLGELCAKQARAGNLVPVPESRLDALPPLPLPPVGPVFGSVEGGR